MSARHILAFADEWPPALVAHCLRRVRKAGRLRIQRRKMRKAARS